MFMIGVEGIQSGSLILDDLHGVYYSLPIHSLFLCLDVLLAAPCEMQHVVLAYACYISKNQLATQIACSWCKPSSVVAGYGFGNDNKTTYTMK